MIFVIPLVLGALGVAAGAVAGALTTHAAGENDRQAAKHHETVANDLNEKYAELKERYNELADESQQLIIDLTRQHILDVIEKDFLHLAVRLHHSLSELRWDIDREPTEVALKEYCRAVELTNEVLRKLNEEEVFIPSAYYANTLMKAEHRKILSQRSATPDPLLEDEPSLEKILMSNVVPMSSQAFQEAYDQIHNTGSQLLQFLHELRAGRLTEGDDSKGLQAVEDAISKSLKALKKQEYQVAVIAAMKAGKSTFLNALIGADVLASKSEACTACRTDIRPIHATETPKLFEYREGQQQAILLAEGEAGEIQKRFLERTHEIRANANCDNTIRFELHHPIEAIDNVPSLAGFKLVDTPGPNEWESANFNTVFLKQTTLEALRTCDAILFVLDYTSFTNHTNSELLQDLIGWRSEFLANNKGKLYFILNKVDQKQERDRAIVDVIQDLKSILIDFGIPEPIIYPASAWEGLLAKLIQRQAATREHKLDFRNFFSARYIQENDDGEIYIPKMIDIAPLALQHSGIKDIETSVIQTIVQNSGWNLLNDVLAEVKKAAQAIDETLATEIRGWEIELESLEEKVEEYKQLSDSSRRKVADVKKSVEAQKQKLINEFSQEIEKFAEVAKQRIQEEIDRVANNQSRSSSSKKRDQTDKNLATYLWEKFGENLGSLTGNFSNRNPDKIRVESSKDAAMIGKTINEYCTPIIHEFWLKTQDKLVRKGGIIREELVQSIQKEIQTISDELSVYIGNSLQIELSSNPIQFPGFEFSGIDAKVQHQQEVFSRSRREQRTTSRCCKSDKVYEVDVPYQETVAYYEVDLKLTLQGIKQKIDEQVSQNLKLLQRVIQKQVSEDFSSGQNQISDYIGRFQAEFDYLLKNRAARETEVPQIIANLEVYRAGLHQDLLIELVTLQKLLDAWNPNL